MLAVFGMIKEGILEKKTNVAELFAKNHQQLERRPDNVQPEHAVAFKPKAS